MADSVWEDSAYVGIFADPYVTGTELEGGHIAAALAAVGTLLKRLAASGRFEEGEHVLRLGKVVQAAAEVSAQVLRAKSPQELLPLLGQWAPGLRQLAKGEVLMVPGGWRGATNGWLAYLLERRGDDAFDLCVCNRGPTGLQYHPTKLFPDGDGVQKLKVMATLRVENIPVNRICDAGFWALAFAQWVPNPSEYHRAEVIYDALLPWVAGASGAERLTSKLRATRATAAAAWRTPCRSNTAFMKSVLEAIRYLGASWGLSLEACKRLSVLLRREMVLTAAEELVLRAPPPEMGAPSEVAQALELLRASGVAVPPRLTWERLRPEVRSAQCKVIALFFSVPGSVCDAVNKLLSELITLVWNRHGGGSLKVLECPLASGGGGPARREWPVCAEAAALARDYAVVQPGADPETCVLLFQGDGQLITKNGLQVLAKDPKGAGFPWRARGLLDKDVRLLRFGCGGLARAALKRGLQEEQGKLAFAVDTLVRAAPKEELPPRLPPAARLPPNVGGADRLPRAEMLRRRDVEAFAGNPEDPNPAGAVDFCSMPTSVATAGEAARALAKALELAKASVRRSREAAVTQRLALEMETIAFVASVFLDLLPMPKAAEGAGIWGAGFAGDEVPPAELRKQTLKAVAQLASLYAHCCQSVEHPTRASDSERCLVSACMMCTFDAVARVQVPGGSDALLSELLREDGGYSVGLGLCANQRPLAEVFSRLELVEPRWLLVRRDVLSYLAAREQGARHRIFEYRQPGAFELRKYSSTVALLRRVLERKGQEVLPQHGPPMTEMEALMEWLFGRHGNMAGVCPELCWLRDMSLLFKFLCTMETRSAELLRKRKDVNEYQFWRLTFDADTAMRPMGMGWHDDVPAIFWDVQGVRGHDQDIADISASAFGRELSLGEGLVVQSPADAGKMLERPGPTEDDVLHAQRLPSFEDTLSPEESEALLSFLTVPYLQIPLVLDFFAAQDRATYLFNPQLQRILRAVLFEPRAYREAGGAEISQVPARAAAGLSNGLGLSSDRAPDGESLFGTPCGLLLSELCHCPGAVLEPFLALLASTADLAKGEVYSPEAPFLLYLLELASDVLHFVSFAAASLGPPAPPPDWAIAAPPGALAILQKGQADLQHFVTGFRGSLKAWAHQAEVRKDTVTCCVVHSYLALEGLSSDALVGALASWAFTRTWHTFGSSSAGDDSADLAPGERLRRFLQAQGIDTKKTTDRFLDQFCRDDGRPRPVFLRLGQQTIRVPNFRRSASAARAGRVEAQAPCGVPEARVFRLVQRRRRDLVHALAVAPVEALNQIAKTALRSQAEVGAWVPKGSGVFAAGDLMLNAQTGELLWRSDGLKPLPDSMTRFEDFETIFGDASLQCGVVSRTKHRLWVHIVGRDFDLVEWDASAQGAFKQGAGPVSKPSAPQPRGPTCAFCSRSGTCFQCERCTMINCSLAGGGAADGECTACGFRRKAAETDDEAPGLQQGFYTAPGRRRRTKVKPVAECVFRGRRYSRAVDIYAETPAEVPVSEQWAMDVLLPVLETLFPKDPEPSRLRYNLLLPEEPLEESAQEMVFLGFDPGADPEKKEDGVAMAETADEQYRAATWKEIVVSRVHKAVMVFNWIPHGRRLYRSLVFCSKAPLALHNLPLDTPDAQKIRGAAGRFGDLRPEEGSLCVLRSNRTLGVAEQYVSPRLLRGVVPSALLEAYSFWEGEDGVIRGIPNDEQSPYFAKNLEITIEDGEVASLCVRRLPGRFPRPAGAPASGGGGAISRPAALAAAPGSAGAGGRREAFREADVLQLAELGFSPAACRLALEACRGDSAAAAAWLFDEGNAMAILAADTESAAMAVDGDDELQKALLMSMGEDMKGGASPAHSTGTAPVDMEVETFGTSWTLVDLHGAKAGSDLATLAQLLARIEDLSHVLVWAEAAEGPSRIVAIEVPRLKLTLLPRNGALVVKDSGGWVVKGEFDSDKVSAEALGDLVCGLNQALVLENGARELQLLVPNQDVGRPNMRGDPFTTTLIFNRSSLGWQEAMDSPYYLYPVHTSLSFLHPPSLAAALYLALLRLLGRSYHAAFALLESCWTDMPLLPEEQWVFNQFAGSLGDGHPDAHAVRCKLALCTAFVDGIAMPFELHAEVDQYLAKRAHVSKELRLSPNEEMQLLRQCKSSTPRVKARLEFLGAQARGQAAVVLRPAPPQHGGQPWSKLCCQSLQALSRGTRVTRLQFKHPALPDEQATAEWPDAVGEEQVMAMLWGDTLLQDDESGVSRHLGFVFLYMVLSGQLSLRLGGADVTASLGELLVRLFHLKVTRWGKEVVEDGEAEVQQSWQMACLAMLSRVGAASGWPAVPSADPVRRALAAGQNLYDAEGRFSAAKLWLDRVDQAFTQAHGTIGPCPPPDASATGPADAEPVAVSTATAGAAGEQWNRPSNYSRSRCEVPPDFVSADVGRILADLDLARFITWEPSGEKVSASLPFDISQHSSARTAVAQDLLRRLVEDCKRYAEATQLKSVPVVCGLTTQALRDIALRAPSSPAADVLARLRELHLVLDAQAAADLSSLRAAITTLLAEANKVQGEPAAVFDHLLRRDLCALEGHIDFRLLAGCLLSTDGVQSLAAANPFGPPPAGSLDRVAAVALLAGRVGLTNRAAFQCRQLVDLIGAAGARPAGAAPQLQEQAELATLTQLAGALGESLTSGRCYLHTEVPGKSWFDPRYLVFEYMQKIVLRPRQVEMVDWFLESRQRGLSRVQQMIMGAGKTTVVGPLLSIMLADPDTMVTQVMPLPLLDQTRHILQNCFATLIPKRIVTFQFDRQVEDRPETVMKIFTKLEACRNACGIVCSSPEAIKSMLLKFVEQLHALAAFDFSALAPGASGRANRELARARDVLAGRSEMADAVVRVVQLWRSGVMIMDEVDVLLHPLKSELNFPIGFRDPIDLSGHRWDLPMHIIDGNFFAAADGKLSDSCIAGTVASDMRANPQHEGHAVLAELQKAIKQGYGAHAMQRTPHAVLLDAAFYHTVLKPIYSRWVLLWLKKHFVGSCNVGDDVLLDFMQSDLNSAQRWKDALESALAPFSLKLLNLASTWIRAILPHVLSKIDRVSFGLLDDKQLKTVDAKAPFSRLVMAVPFVGKDVPSRSSEFAHPDVAIGLTVLAYRYEGLRYGDVQRIVAQLKQDGARQQGPRDTRPAHALFESWVRAEAPASPRHKMRRIDSGLDQAVQNLLPLALFQPGDPRQMARLYKQVQFQAPVSHFWLRQHVFPATMNFHPMKVSASGHELGSSLLFGHRVGFSGTPSNLLPHDLGECFYEPGSDGQVLQVLTDPTVTTAEVCSGDWTPWKLLQQVAESGQYRALIDTGALITNMDNEQVARELLAHLPAEEFDGVVFLDQSDRKMILLRGSASQHRAVALVTSGVLPERRFTFYDQVHTTGMDIVNAPCAKAVVTIGKDMTFRDYAQGAFRMRKVGKGQTVHICVTPEVQTRISSELRGQQSGRLIVDVPAWLLLNSCRTESVQSLKLLAQELANGWRKRALEALVAEVVANAFEGKQPTAERMRRFEPGPEAAARRACLGPFQDKIGFTVDDKVAAPSPFMAHLEQQCEAHAGFCTTPEDLARQQAVLARVARETGAAEHEEMQYGFTAEVVHEQEAEQQQEQEEEQEEEQESAFTRDDEQANPWSVAALAEAPTEVVADAPFYRISAFRARPEQPLLEVGGDLYLTDNFFRPRWVGTGDRKLKTASVVMEWHPELSKERHKRGLQARIRRFFPAELAAASGDPARAAVAALARARDSTKAEPFTEEETSGCDAGAFPRHVVVLTLAEAETLRWIVRSRRHPVVRDVGFLLRTTSGRPLDASPAFSAGAAAAALAGRLCILRLFNSEMFFRDDELMGLEQQLKDVPLHVRRAWFEECLRLRRRRARCIWLDTPVAKLFTPQEEWTALRSQALAAALRRALREKARLEDVEALATCPEWGHDALRGHLMRMRLGFAAGDLQDAVKGFAVNERGLIPNEEVQETLQVPAALAALRDLAGLRAARRAQEEADRTEKASRVWQCQNCTFVNSAFSATCAVCDYGWTGQRECPPDKWCCTPTTGGCTFFNSKALYYCDVCGRARPDLTSMAF